MRSSRSIALSAALGASTFSLAAHACDLCSVYTAGMAHGETTGWYAGVSEQFTRYDELRDEGHRLHDDSGQYVDSSITQAFVGYGITDRLGLQLNLPYIHRAFKRPEEGGIERGTESGMGDAALIAQWTPFRHDDEDRTFVWRLLGGVKFGTGDTDRLREELDEIDEPALVGKHSSDEGDGISGIHGHDLALGSGSTDLLIGTSAFARSGRWFGAADLQYAKRSTGDFDYRFGDDLHWTLGVGRYLVLAHDHSIALKLNLAGETKQLDTLRGERLDDTRSHDVFLGPEIDLTFGPRVALEFRAEAPIDSDNSSIQTTAGYRVRAALVTHF